MNKNYYNFSSYLEDFSLYFYINGKVLREENPRQPSVSGMTKGVYCDMIGLSYLEALQPIIEQTLHKKIYPTYSYTREYRKNSLLSCHRDRESCEISVSISIHQTEEHENFYISSKEKDLSTDEDIICVKMKQGESIIFFGMDNNEGNWHWRDPIQSDSAIQIFLHYCFKDGKYTKFSYEWIKKN